MNAAKALAGAVLAASAACISAGALVSCRQELSPDAPREAASGAEREGLGDSFGSGTYTFFFKNGKHVHVRDCSAYDFDTSGKTTIYQYFQSDIGRLAEWLRWAGVEPEVYSTANPFVYCWARFDTKLLNGVGKEVYGKNRGAAYLARYGKTTKIGGASQLFFARPHESFDFELLYAVTGSGVPVFLRNASDTQEGRDTPAICLRFLNRSDLHRSETACRNAKMTVLASFDEREHDCWLFIDASDIAWFAFAN